MFKAAKAIQTLNSSRASGANEMTIFAAFNISTASLASASLASVSSSQIHRAAPSDAGNIDFKKGSGIFGLFLGIILAFSTLNSGTSGS